MSDQYDVFNTTTPEEEKEKNEQIQNSMNKKYNPFFKLDNGKTTIVRFLQRKPLTFRQHGWIYDPTAYGGKGGHVNTTCLINDCPLCEAGHKARYVGAYQIIEYDASDDGKPMYKVFLKGTNTLVILDKKDQRYDLTSRDFSVTRIGQGVNTVYSFDPEDTTDMPSDVIGEADEDLKQRFAPNIKVCQKLAHCVEFDGNPGKKQSAPGKPKETNTWSNKEVEDEPAEEKTYDDAVINW
jgi:hypothetical protein